MNSYLSSQKLNFVEPKEPKIPQSIINLEKRFYDEGSLKMSKNDLKKEKAMNLAKKKLEAVNFEDRLKGKAKEKARQKRLSKFKVKF